MSTLDLPLSGVRVVEMTHMVMGPTCGMILAQLGAEVIKVEPSAGDKTRSLGGMGVSFFPLFNRGKRSIVLDFAIAEDRELMERLLASADVFVENFRDGQLEKQGLGSDELRSRHPHLIVAGHKGFLSGPYEHRPALDEVVQMMSGLAAMTGTSAKPQRVGSSANDIMGGMFGVIAILAALYQRRSSARGGAAGADIRVGLFENCLFLVAQHMVEYEMTGNKPRSMPERAFSTARLAASAAARSRPAPLATSYSRTWRFCARARDSPPASTSTGWSRCARSCVPKCRANSSMAASPAPACRTGNFLHIKTNRLKGFSCRF